MFISRTSLALAATALALSATAAPAAAADLAVTVTYAGKTPVDAKHDILVFLFTDPAITAASVPLAVQNIPANGGTATFKNVTQDPVYVVTVFNEQANYSGSDGPPPSGLPWAVYGKAGKAAPVSPAKTPQLKVRFDDSRRWQQ